MADALGTITNLINSPLGQFAAGCVLAGIVWTFFERVGRALNSGTTAEVAGWLLDSPAANSPTQPCLSTFVKVFDGLFGTRCLTQSYFWRSSAASICVAAIAWLYSIQSSSARRGPFAEWPDQLWWPLAILLLAGPLGIVPGYLALVKTRYALKAGIASVSAVSVSLVLLADLLVTAAIPGIPLYLFERYMFLNRANESVYGIAHAKETVNFVKAKEVIRTSPLAPEGRRLILNAIDTARNGRNFKATWLLHRAFWFGLFRVVAPVSVFPAFFTLIWLALYAGSGFLLRAARRRHAGCGWFSRNFDIEHKPLQSAGVVAGALGAVLYWTAAMVSGFLG